MPRQKLGYFRIQARQDRQCTFYVLAPNEGAAREDAEELVSQMTDDDWGEIDDDIYVGEAQIIPAGYDIWTGGPNGEWQHNKRQRRRKWWPVNDPP